MVSKAGRMTFDFRPDGIPGCKITFELTDEFFTHMKNKVGQKARSFKSVRISKRRQSKKRRRNFNSLTVK